MTAFKLIVDGAPFRHHLKPQLILVCVGLDALARWLVLGTIRFWRLVYDILLLNAILLLLLLNVLKRIGSQVLVLDKKLSR